MESGVKALTSEERPRPQASISLMAAPSEILFGRYKVHHVLGRGAYGIVYEVSDVYSGRKYALKEVQDVFQSVMFAKRILREARLQRFLRGHENVLHLFQVITARRPTPDAPPTPIRSLDDVPLLRTDDAQHDTSVSVSFNGFEKGETERLKEKEKQGGTDCPAAVGGRAGGGGVLPLPSPPSTMAAAGEDRGAEERLLRDWGSINMYLVTELMETDLGTILGSSQALTLDHARFFTYQILRALKFMTGAGIMHRDIKPRNLLVNANCDLKVCDFGLACPRKECGREGEGGPSSRLTQYVQTRWYRAPEVLYSAFDYDEKVDVWSAGCILSEFFAVPRVVSFRGKSTKGQVEEIITKLGKPSEEEIAEIPHPAVRKLIRSIPTTTLMSPQSIGRAFPIATQSADLCDLLFGLLRFSPKRRFSVEEAISHRFFGQLHDPEDEPLAPPVPPSALDVEKVPNIHGNGNNQNSSSQQSQSTSREGTSRRSNSNSCCSSSAATQTHMLSQTPAGTCKGPAASSTGLECRGTSAAEEGPSRGPGGAARSLLSRAQKVYGGVQNALRMSGRGIGLGMSGMGTGGEREKERRESAGVGGQAEGAEEAEREKDSAKRQAAAQHDGGKVRASSYSSSHPPPGREASSFFSSSSSSSSSRPMPVQRERSEKETALHHNHQQQQGERRGGTGDNAGGDGGAAPPPTTTHHQPVPPPVHQQGRRKEKETGGWGGHHHQQQPPHCLPFGGDVEAMRVFLLESLIAEGAPLLSTAQQTVTVVGGAAGLSPIMPSSAAAMMHTNSHRGNTWPHQGCDASKSTREADDGMSGLAGTRGGSDGGSGSRGRGASTASGGTTGGGVSGSLASFSFSGSGGSGSRTLTDLEPSSSGTLTGTVTDPRGEWKCGGGMLGGGPGVGAERDGLLSICRGSCASSQPSSNSSSSLMNSVAAAAAAAAAGAGGASLFAAASTPPRNSLPLPGGERDRGGGGGFCTLVSADSAALRESALVGEALLPVGSVCSSTNSIPLQQQRGKGRG